jgi:hypothetical protein
VTTAMLEEHAREIRVGHVTVKSFFDPPHYAPSAKPGGQDPPEPVRRWRVHLPNWFPTGSWLDGQHSFVSLEAALAALEESGALVAVDEYWDAQRALSSARQKAFTKLMQAYGSTDKSYRELLGDRHERARRIEREREQ